MLDREPWMLPRRGCKTFLEDAREHKVAPEVLSLVPAFPMDFRELDCLDQRYVIAFAQGRWSPDRGWLRNSSWVDAFHPSWERQVHSLEEKMELWLALPEERRLASPCLPELYREVVVRSISCLRLRRLEEGVSGEVCIRDGDRKATIRKQENITPKSRQALTRQLAVTPYWMKVDKEMREFDEREQRRKGHRLLSLSLPSKVSSLGSKVARRVRRASVLSIGILEPRKP